MWLPPLGGRQYEGKHHYFLTFRADHGRTPFEDARAVDLARSHILRAAREFDFEITAYCLTVGYIVANPVRAGLVRHPAEYPHIGSERYTVAELLEICEYSEAWI